MHGDGDGWVECALGHRHWGKHGAAGLLVYTAIDDQAHVLLQHRAPWCHHGDTWGIPGGARDSHESTSQAALREAAEEGGIPPEAVDFHRESVDDHGGWTYTTVIAHSRQPFETAGNDETVELRWQALSATDQLALHPGFGHTWPTLRAKARSLLIDTANVLGATANGWWRDREGSTTSLLESWRGLPTQVVSGPAGPDQSEPPQDLVVTSVTAVLEGRARGATGPSDVRLVSAGGSGDDTIVGEVSQHPEREWLVVTADRGLRQRLMSQPATVELASPRWLLGLSTSTK
jgi:8-oxo-dGTP pyrophosphatase MutT (NUDIX family)